MTYQATVFAFDNEMIRVVVDTGGSPWFVVQDVRRALGHANPNRSILGAADQGAERCYVAGLGRCERVMIVSEIETYRLIANAKTDRRDGLLRWLLSDITPAIHRKREYVRSGKRYIEYDDTFHWFLNNMEVRSEGYCGLESVYQDYLQWCRKNSVSAASRESLVERLSNLGVDTGKGDHLLGVAVRRPPGTMSRREFQRLNISQEAGLIREAVVTARVEWLKEVNDQARQQYVATSAKVRNVASSGASVNVIRFPSPNDVQAN